MEDFGPLMDFLVEVEQLKKTYRYSTCPTVADSTAEHSWKLAFMASIFYEKISGIDPLHTIEICLAHDLAEYVTGDIDSYRVHTGEISKQQKHSLELKAMEGLRDRLPAGKKVYSLWKEFEGQETDEARYANALDKVEVLLHMIYEGVEKDNAPGYTITYADDAVKKAPGLKPFLREVKKRLKGEYEKVGIEWKSEYDDFP